MAVVLGTSAGFVTTAPTADPSGSNGIIDEWARSVKDTTPSGTINITELGWYSGDGNESVDYEIGIYTHDSGNNKPLDLISSSVASRGTSLGWKTVSVNIDLDPSTIYWLGLQCDITTSNTAIDGASSGARQSFKIGGQTDLTDPWGSESGNNDDMYAIYALIGSTGTNLQLNIGDAWKAVPAVQINIGDAWKAVAGMQINIGDAWKSIF